MTIADFVPKDDGQTPGLVVINHHVTSGSSREHHVYACTRLDTNEPQIGYADELFIVFPDYAYPRRAA